MPRRTFAQRAQAHTAEVDVPPVPASRPGAVTDIAEQAAHATR